MKKLAYVCIALLSFCRYAQGQTVKTNENFRTNFFFAGYEIAIPNNTSYLTKTSWSGARVDFHRMVTPNVSVGFGISFNSFEQYFDKQTYQRSDQTGAITGDMVRQVYTSPLTISTHYYFKGDVVKPYVGIGLGAQYSSQNAYFNIYEVKFNNWGFVARPEIGLMGNLSSNISGFASVAYNYATNHNSLFNINHLSQIPITVGIVFNPDY